MRQCGTFHPEDVSEIASRRLELCRGSRAVDSGQYLYIGLKYYVIFSSDQDNVSLTRIQKQHNVINRDFNKVNPDTTHVPSSGVYNFAGARGTSMMRFMPFFGSEIQDSDVERIFSTSVPAGGFTGLSQVQDFLAAKGVSPESGAMNVYIAPLAGSLLGQAALFSGQCVILSGTVGGPDVPGLSSLPDYNTGRTLTHELGHCLGLPHTFTESGVCPSASAFADIPPQKRPNYAAFLEETDGVWSGSLDNRFRDCNQPTFNIPGVAPPYACGVYDCGTGPYEQFMNFMDYGTDVNALMYSNDQSTAMRAFMLSGFFTLEDGPEVPPDVPGVGEVGEPVEDTGANETGLVAWEIALIAVGGVVFLGVLIGVLVWAKKKGRI